MRKLGIFAIVWAVGSIVAGMMPVSAEESMPTCVLPGTEDGGAVIELRVGPPPTEEPWSLPPRTPVP